MAASNQLLNTILFAPSSYNALVKKGFATVKDVLEIPVSQLAKELDIPIQEALTIRKTILSAQNASSSSSSVNAHIRSETEPGVPASSGLGGQCALELLHTQQTQPPIFTLCQALDEMLGGGIPMGQTTEFCGVPGIGKTQLGIQIACNASIPALFGGVGGAAVYIDTEGSFLPQRAYQIAEGLVNHMQQLVYQASYDEGGDSSDDGEGCLPPKEVLEELNSVDVEKILRNIHYFRAFDYTEQLCVIRELKTFLRQHPEVRIIVIDSVAFHFRRGFDDFALRSRLLQRMAQDLLGLAQTFNVGVVLVNQVTTRPQQQDFTPALGTSWAHACTNRIMLYWSPHNLELEDPSLDGGDGEDTSDSEAGQGDGDNDSEAEMEEDEDDDEEVDSDGTRRRGSQKHGLPQHTSDGRKVWQEYEVCRMAKLLKSPSNQPRVISFEIHPMGVRDRGFARKHRKMQRRLERVKQRQAELEAQKSFSSCSAPPPSRSPSSVSEEEMKESPSSPTPQLPGVELVGQKRRWKDEYDEEFL